MTILLQGQIPDYAVLDRASFPAWAEAPRQYRFDGQTGAFYRGEEELNEITLQPFDYRWVEEARWGRLHQAWLDVAFVDQDGYVSQISLKKDSALNLFAFFSSLKNMEGSEIALAAVRCTLSSMAREAQQDGEVSEYFVLHISSAEYVDWEIYEQVVDFAQNDLFCWVMVGETGDV